MILTSNALIQYLDSSSSSSDDVKLERVLHIDSTQGDIVVIDMTDEKSLPQVKSLSTYSAMLDQGSLTILDVDPWVARPRHLDELTEAEKNGWEAVESIMEPFLSSGVEGMFDASARGRIIRQLVDDGETTKPTVYMHLKRYWRGGQTSFSLIPLFSSRGGKGKMRLSTAKGGSKRGRPSIKAIATGQPHGMNIDEATRAKLIALGNKYYESEENMSLQKVYNDYLAEFFNKGYSLSKDGKLIPILADVVPSFDQFRYWYFKSKNRDEVIIKRKGRREYDQKHRPLIGESTSMAFGPGSIYQIDATVGDIYLVSSLDRRLIIGRPVIYVVIDVFSRLVVGFYVGLEGPSWLGMMLAFHNVVEDKVKFCKSLDIDISEDKWPSKHLPRAVIGDRGELESKDASMLVTGFGVRVSNTPPYRPDWKGIVERHFRLVNEKIIDWLPGAVKLNLRGAKDYRLESALTLRELRKLLALSFLEYNTTHVLKGYNLEDDMRRDRLVPTPLNLWNWGIKNRNGALRYFPEESVKLGLLPRSEATVTPRGLLYEQKYYTCDYIDTHGWRGKARDQSWRVKIAYHPWIPSRIWLKVDDCDDLLECVEVTQRGISGGEHMAELQLARAISSFDQNVAEQELRQAHIQFQSEINHVKENAKQEVAHLQKTMSDRERLGNIRANRSQERELERQEHVKNIPLEAADELPSQPPKVSNLPMFSSDLDSTLDFISYLASDLDDEE